jgi:hypothetical protein
MGPPIVHPEGRTEGSADPPVIKPDLNVIGVGIDEVNEVPCHRDTGGHKGLGMPGGTSGQLEFQFD